jgi:hypothetical protein
MVSGYLNKEIRDRSVIANSLDVIFAFLVYDLETTKLSFNYSSTHCWSMT